MDMSTGSTSGSMATAFVHAVDAMLVKAQRASGRISAQSVATEARQSTRKFTAGSSDAGRTQRRAKIKGRACVYECFLFVFIAIVCERVCVCENVCVCLGTQREVETKREGENRDKEAFVCA